MRPLHAERQRSVGHLIDARPRDGGIVVRLRGPYATPDVDYWPTTGTCAQIIPGERPIVWRHVSRRFAEALALTGAADLRLASPHSTGGRRE